jgi:phosphate transport system protein
MIRSKFDSELEKLNSDLILMGAMCEEAISGVIRALETDDKALAKKLVSEDDKIDMKEREIENECLKLMLQQQPVAKDLRLISSAIKMITDMERIGDQAADIAEIVFFANLSAHISRPRLIDMSQATAKMVTESIDASCAATWNSRAKCAATTISWTRCSETCAATSSLPSRTRPARERKRWTSS